MALNRYDNIQWTDFLTALREHVAGRPAGRAVGIATAAKPLFQSREVATTFVGVLSNRLADDTGTITLAKQIKLNTYATAPVQGRTLTATIRVRVGWIAFASLALFLSGCRQGDAALLKQPRNQTLPAFIPSQLPSFDCPTSSGPSKPVDLQAKAWFDESITLLKPHHQSNIDWKRIKVLEQQAAARHYWPAVREKLKLLHGEQKLVLIEAAMLEGEPEAFFMMGELYLHGDGVNANQAKADAFWQRAAKMGDVQAMVKLAVVLSTKQNNTIGWDLVNIPVATSMLECALKKGYGDAAVPLRDIVSRARKHDGSFAEDVHDPAAQDRGLAVLQEGLKLGSRKAASELITYFMMQHQFKAQQSADRHAYRSINALRARYYQYLENSLNKAMPERLPNLDAAVPLPPTPLPDWRSEQDVIVGLWETATAASGTATAATGRSAK